MSKLEEKFLNHINAADKGIECIKDPAVKAQTHAAIAQAIALFLLGTVTPSVGITTTTTTSSEAMNATPMDTVDGAPWALKFDTDGKPVQLETEDYNYPERVTAYDNAMKAYEKANTPAEQAPAEQAPAEEPANAEGAKEALEQLKEEYCYKDYQEQLDMLANDFSSGLCEKVDDLDGNVIPGFVDYVHQTVQASLDGLQELYAEDYPGKAAYDELAQSIYQDQNATVDYVTECNAYTFYQQAILWRAECYFDYFKNPDSGFTKQMLDETAKELYNCKSVDDINENTVIGFVERIMTKYYSDEQ